MANEPETSKLSSTLATIGIRFLQRLEGQVLEIEAHTKNISDLQNSNVALKKIGEITHQISGLAKPVGYPDLGERAARLDSRIHLFLNGNPDARKIENLISESKSFVHCCLKIVKT